MVTIARTSTVQKVLLVVGSECIHWTGEVSLLANAMLISELFHVMYTVYLVKRVVSEASGMFSHPGQ